MNGTRLSIAALAVSAVLTGCASVGEVTDYDRDVVKKTQAMQQGPSVAPFVNQTGFGPALRCMDRMFVTYGVRDLSVLVEDVPDETKKVSAGGKDMIISAVSEMTRRSRAIRLIAFSAKDATLRLTQGFEASGRLSRAKEDISYMIRGSISQFDDSMVKKQGDAGLTLGPVSGGVARQGSASILGLDLNVIRLADLALVPGVTSKNSVIVTQTGSGADGAIGYKKFGLNFNFVLSRTEGKAQALRTLAELASIELLGRLVKVPYWQCIGGDPKNPEVAGEILDWWEAMAAEPQTLVRYLQLQMGTRGLYEGPVNGVVDPSLLRAISIYQRAMGMSASAELDVEFFKRYLAADHEAIEKIAAKIAAAEPPAAPPPSAPAPATKSSRTEPAPAPKRTEPPKAQAVVAPRVVVDSLRGRDASYRPGEAYEIAVTVDADAHLYCYLIDENRRLNAFFPNPSVRSSRVPAGSRIVFPGSAPFRFVANGRGVPETIACYAATRSLGQSPLAAIRTVRDTEFLTREFKRLAGPQTGVGTYDVKIK